MTAPPIGIALYLQRYRQSDFIDTEVVNECEHGW